jgi:hypothetical protein
MSDSLIYLEIRSSMRDGSFRINSNIKDERQGEILGEFLRTQIAAGKDDRVPVEREFYTIRLALDLSDDSFRVSDDCGNAALRDGILLDVYRQLGYAA